MTLRVAVLGASGRVGRLVCAAVLDAPDLDLVAAVTRPGAEALGRDAGLLAGRISVDLPVVPLKVGCFADAQVVIDFSQPAGLIAALPMLTGRALVSGTTGLDAAGAEALAAHAAHAPVLHAANFSTGVTLLLHLVSVAARALPTADVEVIEAHHRSKVDAPSGTALAVVQAVTAARQGVQPVVHGRHGSVGSRPVGEIGVHAVRGGAIIGEHDVWLVSGAERVQLSHHCNDRGAFADGALLAARWLIGQPPGAYHMADVLGLSLLS